MKLAICLAGPSGTGKSTLAAHIAKTHNIPFITTSTKPLWDKHGITTHAELIRKGTLDPNWGLQFQYEVLQYRIDSIKDVDEFVTDRSPLDNLVYFLLQNTHLCTAKETEDYAKLCDEAMSLWFTGLICLPFTNLVPLEDDKMRVNNRYYQIVVNNTFQPASIMMKKSLAKVKGDTLQMWNWEQRCERVEKLITIIKNL